MSENTAMFRRALRAGALALAAFAIAAPSGAAAEPERPRTNVLLISIDSLRRDLLGSYGADLPHRRGTSPSPHLDRLAREGVRLVDAYAPSPWTLPSHVTVMTGLTPMVHGVETDMQVLDPRQSTLAGVLKANGYRTAGVFSGPYLEPYWGFGNGFDHYRAAYGEIVARASREVGRFDDEIARALAKGDDAAAEDLLWERRRSYEQVRNLSHADVSSTQVTGAAIEEMSSLAAGAEPWFLFVHYFDVHYDYVAPAPFGSRFDPDYRGEVTGHDFLRDPRIAVPDANLTDGWIRKASPRDLEHVLALYAGEVAWVDDQIGRLLAKLAALGQEQRTLVIVMSDHGDEFFEHGGIGHRRTLHEEVVRIPLLMRLPGVLPAGAVTTGCVTLADVYPTVLDLLDLPSPNVVTGRTMVPLVRSIDDGETRVQFSRLVRFYDGSVQISADLTIPVRLATVLEAFWYGSIKIFRSRKWPLFPRRLTPDRRAALQAEADREFQKEDLGWVDLARAPDEPHAAISSDFSDPRARAALEAFRTRYRDLRTRGRAIQRTRLDETMRSKLEGLGYVVTSTQAPQSPRHGFALPVPGDTTAPAPR